MNLDKYKIDINKVQNIFLSKIPILKVSGISLYGSVTNKALFDDDYSDIDIIVFCKNYEEINKKELIDFIEKMNLNFLEKKPTRYIDSLCDRIEFYIGDFSINFDITITSKLIPNKEDLIHNAWYDSFEALMGGVYQSGIRIYGKPPDYDIFEQEFLPFYCNDIWYKRLDIISNRLMKTLNRMKQYRITDKNKYIDYTLKFRKYFLKFLFIQNKKYYLTPEKNLLFQLTNILKLNEEVAKKLTLLDDSTTYNQCLFIEEYARKTVKKYLNERKNNNF